MTTLHTAFVRCAAMVCLAVSAIASFATADEATDAGWVNLITREPPDSLAGWDLGGPVHGWVACQGSFRGLAGAGPLVSGWTVGDFALKFDWNVAAGATLVIRLPDVPKGEGAELRLVGPDKQCTLSVDGQQVAALPAQILKDNAWHTARIDRTGDRLKVNIDGHPLGETKVDAARRFGLELAVDGGPVDIGKIELREPAGESIFNGHDLAGWWSPMGLASWRGKDGVIENLHKDNNYLRTEKQYGNFTLSLEFKTDPHVNSGIGIRTAREGWPSGDGMELQILDSPGLNHDSTMAIYRNVEPLARADRSQEWTRVVIKADGPMVSAWVNGQLVQQANTARHPELKHRHPSGWIGFQDHGGKVEFRDIRVLSAPDGTGLAAWYAPQAITGPELLCDRLLDPARLSVADGIQGGVVATAVAGSDEQILADLVGPGALTRIWHSEPGGKLAFYFDDQAKPAIQCRSDQLWAKLAPLYEQKDPVLTCLPYAKRLKIVLREGAPTDYRIEYVTFPPDVPVETFSTKRDVLPRGWLAAIDYRGHQYSWGTHREADPEPRESGEIKTLDPGQTATVVTRSGKGIVQWLKLQTSFPPLGNDDLWLEVLIDGESEPAIAAPARYFFPSLVGAGNHDNFLAVYRTGFTSMLAMPFGDGITIRVRNAGKAILADIGVTLSVIEDESGTWQKQDLAIDRRLRLRGQFHRAAGAATWLEWRGTGRWVGLVAQSPEDSSPQLLSVVIDGNEQPGWKSVSLDAIAGIPGDEKEAFRLEGGHAHGLAWRYWQLAPISFQQSIVVKAMPPAGDCLSLIYVR
ncbi:MAG TPA: family 16 glycoside hydrolase [Pirellulales bacterium]|nr:family 16 glycoside hydrolase [Pirellulales bacterium]